MRERLRDLPPQPDVVVVGGGINGAGVARDAALRGYRVVLVEKHDFGFGSSSRTSKLVHGGVRYLEHGELRLVREASHERRTLLRLAPHLVRPLPFVFPVYRDSRFGLWKLRAGMWLYDLLAGFRNVSPHRMLRPRGADAWREGLRDDGLRGAALYYDAAMDDARLVLANVLAARDARATVLNRVEVSALRPGTNAEDGANALRPGANPEVGVNALQSGANIEVELRDLEDGAVTTLRARCVVACIGPWSNSFLAALPGVDPPLATTRGTHVVVRRLTERAFTLAAGRDGRVFFVLPWLGQTLLGTTDVDDAADPESVAPTEAEIEYLLGETNRYFPAAHLVRSDVRAAFAGLRPLLRAGEDPSSRSREHAVLEPMPGVLAVVGGKYTTYRAVAESVVDRVAARLGKRQACRTARLPLPGGALAWSPREHWEEGPRFVAAARELAARASVPEPTARHWLAVHGDRAVEIAALAAADASLAAALCPHVPHVRAEVAHAVRSELALRLEDWFLRRSRHVFAACNGLDAIEPVAAVFAAELGWDAATRRQEIEACQTALQQIARRS